MSTQDNKYDLDRLKYPFYHHDKMIDNSLMKFSYEMKALVINHKEYGYSTLSSFLSDLLKEFDEFHKYWEKERNSLKS